jgi:hypothetical protein
MYCPRCGQQQISDETKFCSRCGFQMGLVSQLLAHGGFLPQLAELYQGKSSWFTRKNGVIFSFLWFIVFVMMLPVILAIAGEDDGAGVLAVFGVFTSLIMLIVSLAFLKKTPKVNLLQAFEAPPQPAGLYGNQTQGALPPQQTQPVTDYVAPQGAWKTPDTGEFARPGSVTEGTTKLLQKDE